MILSQCCIDFDTKTYRFGHISGPSYRGAHAGWPAGWLVGWLVGWLAGWLGHQNASKTCTLSQKVGRKRVPLGRKSTSKPLIILDTKMRQKRVPLARKSVENVYL